MDTPTFNTDPLRVAEISHRMSNGFQMIQSYTRRQLAECQDDEARRRLGEVLDQIRSVASQSKALARADLGDLGGFLDLMEPHWVRLGVAEGIGVVLRRDRNTTMPPQISEYAARILLEAVSNSLEHAFPDNRTGEIRIEATLSEDQTCRLRVEDNGVGLRHSASRPGHGSGTGIVRSLAGEIGGSAVWQDRTDGGTVLIVEFSVNIPESIATLNNANG
ncbi:sensor histidine kinase [Marinibacterium profundimaris]|nr:sensor histidine kinase [Marinibacterium profundimaris]